MRSARLALTTLLHFGLAALLAAAPLPAQQISLSLERFQKLWDQAHPAPVVPPPPAVPLALESARIDITAGADSARLATEIAVTLTPGGPPGGSTEWQTLPLAGLGALLGVTGVTEVTGGPAPAFGAEIGEVSGVPVVRLRGAGRYRMTVESVVPLAADPAAVEAERSLEVKLPAAAWVTGSLAAGPLAEGGVRRVEALGGGSVREEGPGRWSLVGEPGAILRLRLFGRPAPAAASTADDEPLSFDAETASALAVSRARRRLTAFVGVHVRSGRPEQLERLSLPLPPGYEVLSVTGDRVADWEVAEGTLAVRLRRAAGRDLEIEVQLAADPAPEVDCPLLVPAGARTVRGALKVAVRGNDGLLEPVGGRAVERLPLEQAASFADGFRNAPGEPLQAAVGPSGSTVSPRWTVTWAIGGDVLTGQIDRLVVEALLGEAGTAHYQVWAQVRNGVATLDFALPEGARLLAARRDGGEVTLGSTGTGGGWAVPMVVREAPQIIYLEALLAAELPARGGRLALPLPRLGVPASRVEVRLVAPPGFRYSLAEPGRAGALGPPPGAGSGSAPTPTPAAFLAAPPGFTVLEAAWAGWSKDPPPLLVDVVPVPSGRSRR